MDRTAISEGEMIFKQGESSDVAYVIEKGVIEIFEKEKNYEKRLALLTRGMMFGEYGVLDGAPRSASARAIIPTDLKIMPLQPGDQ